jgi:hypothetical protein
MIAGGVFAPAILVTAAGFVIVGILFALFVRNLARQPDFDRLKTLCLGPSRTGRNSVRT